MKRLKNIHPGEILLEEFLTPIAIIKGKRAITADTALRLAKYFGVSAKFWLGLQDDFDIENESRHLKKTLNSIRQFKATAA
jgi:antitoxin HigA-1